MTLRPKLVCALPKIVYAPQERYNSTGSFIGAMLTKPTKSARPDKPTVSIMPTLPSSSAMTRDLAYYAYITNKTQRLNYQRWSLQTRPWPQGRPTGHI